MPQEKIYTVSELSASIRGLIESNLGYVWVRGEICEYSVRDNSGHVYFSVKDAQSTLKAVYFRGALKCRSLKLEVGSEVEVHGRMSTYAVQSYYQIQVDEIRPVGQGSLRQQFEEMKARLCAEGLFDPERKRAIPRFPKCVGVVTSADGAALQDFLNVLGRRHSGMNVRIFPCPVQGADAAQYLAGMVMYINKYQLSDVIVLTRGGGSLEDLWPFNEEVLARAIFASEIPVISAVGHEINTSISDYVADMACVTPSAAAEQVVSAKAQLLERIEYLRQRLVNYMTYRLSETRRRYERCTSCQLLKHPEDMTNLPAQRLDLLTQRLGTALPRRLELAQQKLASTRQRMASSLPGKAMLARQALSALSQRLGATLPALQAARQREWQVLDARLQNCAPGICAGKREKLASLRQLLNALNPAKVLSRGYSIIFDENGKVLRDASQVQVGSKIEARLERGTLDASVTSIEAGANNV